MKFKLLVSSLILFPLYAFSHPQDDFKDISLSEAETTPNTSVVNYFNETADPELIKTTNRSNDFPTQIIRMNTNISNQEVSCAEVHAQINKVLENIRTNQFIGAMAITCHYDSTTYLATHFTIDGYFDPIDDDAIVYLKSYLNQYNGSDLLGTQLRIESAKGLIVSLSVAVGMKKNMNTPPFNEHRRDRSNFYFKNNYEMKNTLLVDVKENFYSNNPEKLLPFIERWTFSHAGSLYKVILKDANYIELQPERIFLMENGEKIFVSSLKQYFMHHCGEYENHRCLSPT